MAGSPFQVFHMPEGIPLEVSHLREGYFGTLRNWLERTLSSNPVEAIYGTYTMVRDRTCKVVYPLMDTLKQRTSVMVRKILSHSYNYLMIINIQALEKSQQSRSFSLPANVFRLVMNKCCLA